jgi:hypothetical protein
MHLQCTPSWACCYWHLAETKSGPISSAQKEVENSPKHWYPVELARRIRRFGSSTSELIAEWPELPMRRSLVAHLAGVSPCGPFSRGEAATRIDSGVDETLAATEADTLSDLQIGIHHRAKDHHAMRGRFFAAISVLPDRRVISAVRIAVGQWYSEVGACDQCSNCRRVKLWRGWTRLFARQRSKDRRRHGLCVDRLRLETASGKHCAAFLGKLHHRGRPSRLIGCYGWLHGSCNGCSFELGEPVGEFTQPSSLLRGFWLSQSLAPGTQLTRT